jgi:hypothetical protein
VTARLARIISPKVFRPEVINIGNKGYWWLFKGCSMSFILQIPINSNCSLLSITFVLSGIAIRGLCFDRWGIGVAQRRWRFCNGTWEWMYLGSSEDLRICTSARYTIIVFLLISIHSSLAGPLHR